jgi:hypothetical protein
MLYVRWAEFESLKLNELGDLFAGVVGPVALIWVVLGYFQQGHELREATAQNAELTRVGAEQLVEAKKAQELIQERHDLSFEPVFAFQSDSIDPRQNGTKAKFGVVNLGHPAGNLVLVSHDNSIDELLFVSEIANLRRNSLAFFSPEKKTIKL